MSRILIGLLRVARVPVSLQVGIFGLHLSRPALRTFLPSVYLGFTPLGGRVLRIWV